MIHGESVGRMYRTVIERAYAQEFSRPMTKEQYQVAQEQMYEFKLKLQRSSYQELNDWYQLYKD